ncbi:MAG: AAA family ATPase [Magnetospirillum sp. WYHS-4]
MKKKSAAALPAEKLYTPCDPALFDFATTADLKPLEEMVGQDRAVQAVRFAVGMRHDGFNLYALGPEGLGKASLVRRTLVKEAAARAAPGDWCYVNNFKDSHKPLALKLPSGRGRPLREDMDRLVDDLGAAIPATFESDEFRNRKGVVEEKFKENHEDRLRAIRQRAEDQNVALIRTPVGLALAPVRDGEILNPQEFEELPDKEKAARKAALEGLQTELEGMLAEAPKWEKEQREQIRALVREVTAFAVDHLIDELKKRWEDVPEVLEYLEAVRRDVVDNVGDFLPQEKDGKPSVFGPERPGLAGSGPLRRYQVNLMVDNGATQGAPIVEEDHPTQPNLVGRIEHLSQFGTLVTDFNLIKAGALHRANGGYLILDVRKLLAQPFAYESLKRALQSRRVRIESAAESLGWTSTQTLEPEPIPLEVKVVLLGDPMLYYLLGHYDPDFGELFKVAADFDTRMDRSPEAALQYASLIAAIAAKEGLRPLDRGAVARVVEQGSRLAEDAEKLTTHMASVADLVREADFWAGQAGAKTVEAAHVQQAIDAWIYRSDRIRERLQEEILRGTLVVETQGEKVGEINGLAVLMLDSYSFGKPTRISCRVRIGRGDLLDIEREVALGGPLHTKGVLILTSYLSTRYARELPLSLSASLVFEQSYGGIDGDSASSAELYALLSAISGVPIKQNFAVTGSVDQNGRVQVIGGVNEKVEGFFDLCRARGLTGDQGVLIPAANVKHLMLKKDVVDAVRADKFHLFAVETVDQGIEILTGLPAGAPDDKGEYPIGSVNRAVAGGLAAFTRKARQLASEAGGGRQQSANGNGQRSS